MRDLGLTYEQALHGIQSAIRFRMSQEGFPESLVASMLKHLRVGVDARASDALGLVELLIKKGVFTGEEYIEHARLALNEELILHEEKVRYEYSLPDNLNFR